MFYATRDEARQQIRARWREILPTMTGPARMRVNGETSYICPLCEHGAHGDGLTYDPQSTDKNGLHCFGCQFSGDIIDLYQQRYNTDYNEALQELAASIGIVIEDAHERTDGQRAAQKPADDKIHAEGQGSPENANQSTREGHPLAWDAEIGGTGPTAGQAQRQRQPLRLEDIEDLPAETVIDLTAEVERAHAELWQTPSALEYMRGRGLSDDTIKRYKLGYDPKGYNHMLSRFPAMQRGGGKTRLYRYILPYPDAGGRFTYFSAEIEDRAQVDEYNSKYIKIKAGDTGIKGQIFNERYLKQADPPKVIFITEGIYDALSVEEAGGAALAFVGTAHRRFLSLCKQYSPRTVFIIGLDSDEAGQGAADRVSEGLDLLQIPYIKKPAQGAKDYNEALQRDREAFKRFVQDAQEEAVNQMPPLPGLLTYEDAINIFETADDSYLEFKSFPEFSKAAKIQKHDTVALAADTGAGKSSLAINFMNDLNEEYPCIYFNLEMSQITVLRRLTAIYTGVELDRIEGYKNDENTAAAVNTALKAITSRQPLQIIQGAYMLQEVEAIIKASTRGRETPTIVIIDHSLLMDTKDRTAGRYDRFTQVSEGLRKMALRENIILIVLLQQNRQGKADEGERPKNSSLKESGSWENDATHICFLWYDPADGRKKLLLTKNRGGENGEFILNYWKRTQTYSEAAEQTRTAPKTPQTPKQSKREKTRQKLQEAYEKAYTATDGKPTLQAMAEAADVSTSTVKTWAKEYGGFIIDGKKIDPAGADAAIEQAFIKLAPEEQTPFDQEDGKDAPAHDFNQKRGKWTRKEKALDLETGDFIESEPTWEEV